MASRLKETVKWLFFADNTIIYGQYTMKSTRDLEGSVNYNCNVR